MNSNVNQNKTKDESDLFGAGLFCGTLLTVTIIGGAFILSELLGSDDSSTTNRQKTSKSLSALIDEILKEDNSD